MLCVLSLSVPNLQLNEPTCEGWTDLNDDDKFSGCREPCLKIGSVCRGDAGCYRCCVSNSAGTVVSSPIELVLGQLCSTV